MTISRRARRPVVVTAIVLGAVVALVANTWAGRPLTLSSLLTFAIVGIATGSIYAISASGLVVTYTTSGVFNFAQGAVGMFMAFLYWELRVAQGWPTLLAVAAVVLVVAPVFGMVVERLLIRRIREASLANQLVVTLGLMLALMGVAGLLWPANEARSLPFFFGNDGFQATSDVFVTWHRAIAVAVAALVAVMLRLVLYRTRIGLAMRAVVDDRELAVLNGVRAHRASMLAWALGSSLAALAGIFVAPEVGLVVGSLTLLIIDAFAAAVIGRLRSLPLTFLGGMIIGLLTAFALGYLDLSGRWTNARRAIPTVLLFAGLLALPDTRLRSRLRAVARSPRIPTLPVTARRMVLLVGAVALLAVVLDDVNVNRLTVGLLTSLVMLSLVPLTGWSGNVSLAQMTFVGVGAFAAIEVTEWQGVSSPGLLSLVAASVFAVPFGLLMAAPAVRLSGLYLALSSMAFALLMELLFFPQPEVFAGTAGGSQVTFGRLSVLGYDFTSRRSFLLLVAVCFALIGIGLTALRRSAYGRRLLAMRDSPAGCVTIGMNVTQTKVVVYMLSAAIAGFAGALFAMHSAVISAGSFTMLASIPVLVLAVIGGVATIGGTLVSNLGFAVIQDSAKSAVLRTLELVGPGFAAMILGKRPNGIVPDLAADLRSKGRPRPHALPPTSPSDTEPASPSDTERVRNDATDSVSESTG